MNPEGDIRRRDRKISSQNRKRWYDGDVEKSFPFSVKMKKKIMYWANPMSNWAGPNCPWTNWDFSPTGPRSIRA